MRITVFGVGYVGLVQAAVLADVGNDVLCVDINPQLIASLTRGEIAIYEPGLAALVQKNLAEQRLVFTTDMAQGVAHGEVIFIAVGTPQAADGSADLRYVVAVAESIATFMEGETIVVNKSTVPVGTAALVKNKINAVLTQRARDISFDVVSNPEFLKEGSAVNDCMRPERIILGLDSENSNAAEVLKELYAPFCRNHEKLMIMDIKSAELTKYAANCMLATKISFMNEMANLAELVGADIEMVRKGIGSDPRIGYQFIYPGCGYGGSCLPKDVKALIRTGNNNRYPLKILEAVDAVNEQQKYNLIGYLLRAFNGDIAGKTLAVWGLAFKPNTDDMREASSQVLLNQLWQHQVAVQAYDPQAAVEAQAIFGPHPLLHLMATKEAALAGADALVICTEWQQFRAQDFDFINRSLRQPIIVDGRNLYDPKRMKRRGFQYYAVGRGESLRAVN